MTFHPHHKWWGIHVMFFIKKKMNVQHRTSNIERPTSNHSVLDIGFLKTAEIKLWSGATSFKTFLSDNYVNLILAQEFRDQNSFSVRYLGKWIFNYFLIDCFLVFYSDGDEPKIGSLSKVRRDAMLVSVCQRHRIKDGDRNHYRYQVFDLVKPIGKGFCFAFGDDQTYKNVEDATTSDKE